jgi:hypothetical protein
MPRLLTGLTLVLFATACAGGVNFTGSRYMPLPDSTSITVIDADGMDRPEIERVLVQYTIISRTNTYVADDEHLARIVAKDAPDWQQRARQSGAHAVMYTRQSAVVATIMQNTRYLSPSETVAVYYLRKR